MARRAVPLRLLNFVENRGHLFGTRHATLGTATLPSEACDLSPEKQSFFFKNAKPSELERTSLKISAEGMKEGE